MKYGFIGFGNLAKAIYQGLKDESDLKFAYHSKNNQHKEIQSFERLEELIHFADVIWLCVKPQIAKEVLDQLKTMDLSGKLIVSTLAGVKISSIQSYLNQSVAMVRIMPNLAMAYGQSVTAYCTSHQPSGWADQVKTDLQTLGELIELSEGQFNLFTSIFGSGPGFLLEMMQAFKSQLSQLNLDPKKEDQLLAQLMLGTSTYLNQNAGQKNLEALVEGVASKGGVTEAGLKYFREENIQAFLEKMIERANERAKEIEG